MTKNYEIESRKKPAANERFGAMAGAASLESATKQQVTWLVASVGSPPLRQAAIPLSVILG